jgi:hypothetical protein
VKLRNIACNLFTWTSGESDRSTNNKKTKKQKTKKKKKKKKKQKKKKKKKKKKTTLSLAFSLTHQSTTLLHCYSAMAAVCHSRCSPSSPPSHAAPHASAAHVDGVAIAVVAVDAALHLSMAVVVAAAAPPPSRRRCCCSSLPLFSLKPNHRSRSSRQGDRIAPHSTKPIFLTKFNSYSCTSYFLNIILRQHSNPTIQLPTPPLQRRVQQSNLVPRLETQIVR